ncbi:MAG TPA: DUF3558 family protein [Pseudonocardiaceae bacterium]
MSKVELSGKLMVLVAAVAATGSVLVACSGASTPSGTSTATSASPADTSWYTSIKSCDLLDQSQLKPLGYTVQGYVTANDSTENSCEWDQGAYSTLGIELSAKTFDSLKPSGGPVTDITIAGRPGKISPGTQGTCDLAIKATSGSRARIIVALAVGNGDQACEVAKQAATDIAPKLPALK